MNSACWQTDRQTP